MRLFEGDRMPRCYGFSYWDLNPLRREAVCFPVPVNLVVRWIRAAWIWCIESRTATWEKTTMLKIHAAYQQGFVKGADAGMFSPTAMRLLQEKEAAVAKAMAEGVRIGYEKALAELQMKVHEAFSHNRESEN